MGRNTIMKFLNEIDSPKNLKILSQNRNMEPKNNTIIRNPNNVYIDKSKN